MCFQGFFSGIETGLVSMRKSRVKHGVKKNLLRAKILDFFIERPGVMLATTLVGTNICVVCSATMVKKSAVHFGYNESWHMFVASTCMTVFLLAAEIIPKDWFRQYPYHRCLFFAYPLYLAYILLIAPVRTMAAFTSYTTKLFSGKKVDKTASLMREDFRMLLYESEDGGIIDAEAADILDRSLEFHELRAYDIFIPYHEVEHIPGDMSVYEAVDICRKHKRSRLPVNSSDKGINRWRGIFTVYDALFAVPEKEWKTTPVSDCLRPIAVISEDSQMEDILLKTKKSGTPMLVVHEKSNENEHIGIVTTKDVLKVLFG